MNLPYCKVALPILFATFFALTAQADNLDLIGVRLVHAVTNLNGAGIHVAQVEAAGSTTNFEVYPAAAGQPVSLFTYIGTAGSANTYPNSVGMASDHANLVGAVFYGTVGFGVATNVAHVDNYDANAFVDEIQVGPNYFVNLPSTNINDPVVNSSFTWGGVPTNEQKAIDSAYDNYAAQFNTLFVSAACNASVNVKVSPPGTAYNCISVASYRGNSSIGPTPDNGRCKPDITAPFYADNPDERGTSFTTPLVAGAAALLMQAGLRGDGGSDTNAAFDIRTIKALLLNGAVKPADWTNSNSSPLDARYGAGMLNVFNACEQLAGGKNNPGATSLILPGAAHPPVVVTNTVMASSGWDFQILASGATNDAVNHYFFNVSNGAVTATLVWNRHLGEPNINDLDLFIFNAANSNLVACSTSRVDNVEHLFVPQLAAGRYDLQVLKNGGTNDVGDAETYALAWAFVAPTLSLAKSGPNTMLTWPVYPAGFRVEATTNLLAPAWSTNNFVLPVITNSRNSLILNVTNAQEFFRLRQPNF